MNGEPCLKQTGRSAMDVKVSGSYVNPGCHESKHLQFLERNNNIKGKVLQANILFRITSHLQE
jgi:hypothetical protein